MSEITGALKGMAVNERALEALKQQMEAVFVGGIQITVERVWDGKASIRLFLTDAQGERLVEMGGAELYEGDSLTATGMQKALTVVIAN